ncbi:MAG: hypothetical protein ACHRXM_01140 [Isosphaerales bacterium]
MIAPSPSDETIDNPQEYEGPVKALLRLTATVGFLHSTDGRFYAQVSVAGRPEVFALRSPAFRAWLIEGYFRECLEVPSDWSIRRALAKLEATARFEGGTPSIFIRVGHDGNGGGHASDCYLDLGDPGGHAVKIGPEGWSVVEHPRIHFRRPPEYLPLPAPSRDGSIELLRPYVNISESDFRLLIVWMANAIRPVGPYPVLALYGETGAAKTSLAKIVRMLIDPHASPLRGEPRTVRGLMRSTVNRWLVAYDNIRVIPDWLSDALCLLSTGGAFDGHASFSDDEQRVIHAQRPVILSGIEEFVRRSDLSDRSLFNHLPPIAPAKRLREDRFWQLFNQDYPRILGGLLDAVAGGLRELPSVELAELPRMADFAVFAEAVGRNLRWPAGTVLSDYNDNRCDAAVTHIEESPVASFLLEWAHELNDWSGTSAELLAQLNTLVEKKVRALRQWPKAPSTLAKELRRIAPHLRLHGISIAFEKNREKHLITLTKTNRPKNQPSRLSNNLIGRCFSDTFDEEKFPET